MLAGFGDSIMKGVVLRRLREDGKPEYELTAQSLIERCAQRLGVTAANYARFGCTAPVGEKMVERYEDRLQTGQNVLLCYGGNDSDYDWQSIAEQPHSAHEPKTVLTDFIEAYKRMIERIRHKGATPFIMSLPPMDANRYFEFVTRNLTELQRGNVLAWLNGTTDRIIAGHELYNQTVRQIAADQGVCLLDGSLHIGAGQSASDYLCADGIHPNDAGLTLLADSLAGQLRALVA